MLLERDCVVFLLLEQDSVVFLWLVLYRVVFLFLVQDSGVFLLSEPDNVAIVDWGLVDEVLVQDNEEQGIVLDSSSQVEPALGY